MKLEIATLCDAATADNTSKLNILGSFDTVWAKAAPVMYGPCTFAAKIRFDDGEPTAHRVHLSFTDLDGKVVVPPVDVSVNVNRNPGRTAIINLVFNFSQIRFERFGEYIITLAVDGRELHAAPLYLIQQPVV